MDIKNIKVTDVEIVVDYIPVTISGIFYRPEEGYKSVGEFEEKPRTFTFFYENNGEIHCASDDFSADGKKISHLGSSFFERAFGKKQLNKINKLCKMVGSKMVERAESVTCAYELSKGLV